MTRLAAPKANPKPGSPSSPIAAADWPPFEGEPLRKRASAPESSPAASLLSRRRCPGRPAPPPEVREAVPAFRHSPGFIIRENGQKSNGAAETNNEERGTYRHV